MARKSGSALVQEELYPPAAEISERERMEDSRLLDLEAEQQSPFLRAQKRVSVRKNAIPKKAAKRLKWVALGIVVIGILGVSAGALYSYGEHSWRFRIDSSDQIEISGAQHVTHAQIMEVMGGDIGRNIFFIPLDQRKHQLEQIPWVESASVMRFVPNRIHVEIHERAPVAFARIGSRISLIDSGGTLMEFAPGRRGGISIPSGSTATPKYSFPVITGMNPGDALTTRAARMKNYNELVRELDSGGAQYSKELSEVDLSDPEDVKVLVADPNGDVLIHLGSGNYLQRFKIYIAHAQQWRQQFDKLESVDLRYEGQIIVNPDLKGAEKQPVLTPVSAKAPATKSTGAPKHPATPAAKKAAPKKKATPVRAHHVAAAAPPAKPALPPQQTPGATKPQTASSTAPAALTTSASAGSSQKKPSAGIPKETSQPH